MATLTPIDHQPRQAIPPSEDGLYAELCILTRRTRRLIDTLGPVDPESDLAPAATATRSAWEALSAACELTPLPVTPDAEPVTRLHVGDLTVCVKTRTATANGKPVPLTRSEFDLLVALARDPEAILTKADLLTIVWGYRTAVRTRAVDTHLSRLRRKLQDALPGTWCVNHWGIGYSLTSPVTRRVAA